MNMDVFAEVAKTVVYLLPLLGLVWKGAKLTARLEQLENTVKEKTMKFCNDHSRMAEKIEQERMATDTSIATLMNTLNEIQKSIVRIETKLEIADEVKK